MTFSLERLLESTYHFLPKHCRSTLTARRSSTNNRHILEETDDKFFFPSGALKAGQDNVITVVQDNMGLNETDGCSCLILCTHEY